MSAVSLGDIARCGELRATKVISNQKEVNELNVSGTSTFAGVVNFENTVNTTASAPIEANGRVVMSNAELFMLNLPTADPNIAGRLYRTGTNVHVSLG
jgi:hypothetical protein